MGTSNAAESRNIPSFRRVPFIGVAQPRDVPDLPVDDNGAIKSREDAAGPPQEATTPKPGSPDFIGPLPRPKQTTWNWKWGLIGLGVAGVVGYAIVVIYQNQRGGAAPAPTAASRLFLNSTTALNAPHDTPGRSSLPTTGAPAPDVTAVTSTPRGGPLGAASGPQLAQTPAQPPEPAARLQTQPQLQSQPQPQSQAQLQPSATDVVTENRTIVAAPMTGDDQRRVLDLVAATNSVVLQLKHQVDDDTKRMRAMQAQLDDMKQMVSLTQAKLLSTASEIAMGNIQPTPLPTPPVAPALPRPAVTPPTNTEDVACRVRPVYTIASASPQHVTLRGGGESFLDFGRNDVIPCYGHVLEITQEGSRWVVKTDHDVIGRN